MKKLFTLTLGMLAGLSTLANPIGPQRAMKIAQEYLVPGHTMSLAVSGKARKASSKSAPYYIISRGENQGFVIVSGDDALPEVLGYTEKGDFDAENLPPFLTWYLNYYTQLVESAQSVGAGTYKAPALAPANRHDISPLVQTHWHQTSPYNDKCPKRVDGGGRCLTGCVATAASQILYYWHKDLTNVTLASTSSYIYGDQMEATTAFPKGTQIKWDLMATTYTTQPAEYKDAVATLVAVVGGGAGLTYGESTSGYNSNCIAVFSNIFGMNGGKENNKDWGEAYNNYSDDAWATLLYTELVNNRPVLYSGCSAEGDGHAVVVDGYKASNGLFHFNLGWGNPSAYDGYFNVGRGLSPSWGFNNSWQECVTGVCPKSFNYKCTILPPQDVYKDAENTFTVNFENNATLACSGIYLFAGTSSSKPSKLTNAKDSYTEIIPTGSGVTVKLKAKPTSDKEWFFTVTDANLNILAQYSTTPKENVPELTMSSLAVKASTDVEQFDGKDFQVVYNTSTTVVATLNNKKSVGYDGSMKLEILAYSDSTNTWEAVGTKSSTCASVGYDTFNASFSVLNNTTCPIEKDKYYMAKLVNPIHNTDTYIGYETGADSVVRFILRDGDMEVVSFENNILTIKGNFDATRFNSTSFARSKKYETALVYDLRQCTGVNAVSQEVNPNAVYYVADDSKANGKNVIKAGKCAELSLKAGYNYSPLADFTADAACLEVDNVAGRWSFVTMPFETIIPNGMYARDITSHASTGIIGKAAECDTLLAGHTYLLMTSSREKNVLKATSVDVVAAPVQNTDSAVVGTFVATTVPANSFLIDDQETQYFSPVEEGSAVAPFGGYFTATNVTKAFRVNQNTTTDPYYVALAEAIQLAYEVYNEYKPLVYPEVQKAFCGKIEEAETVFTTRSLSGLETRNYASSLISAADEYIKNVIGVHDVEIDFTDHITNPSFETKNKNGWTQEEREDVSAAVAGTVVSGAQYNQYRGVGLDGTYLFQSFIPADSSSIGVSQTVSGLKPGYYRLTAKVGTAPGHSVTVFAGEQTDTVEAHMLGRLYLNEACVDSICVNADEGLESGSLTIGVKAGYWYKADDFRLVFIASLPGEVPTEIESVVADGVKVNRLEGIYNLNGQKIDIITVPGIYIIDGKKKFMK